MNGVVSERVAHFVVLKLSGLGLTLKWDMKVRKLNLIASGYFSTSIFGSWFTMWPKFQQFWKDTKIKSWDNVLNRNVIIDHCIVLRFRTWWWRTWVRVCGTGLEVSVASGTATGTMTGATLMAPLSTASAPSFRDGRPNSSEVSVCGETFLLFAVL